MEASQFLPIVVLAAVAAFSATTYAQERPVTARASTSTADMTDGEIRKINKDTQKITIKHREIKNLHMPGMIMVFQVKDSALLGRVKVGDKVKFVAEKSGDALVVTDIQAVK